VLSLDLIGHWLDDMSAVLILRCFSVLSCIVIGVDREKKLYVSLEPGALSLFIIRTSMKSS
jgi:hypothetical protein